MKNAAKLMQPEELAESGTEHGHQAALFLWATRNQYIYPDLRDMFAIPNGGHRHWATASKLAAEGVQSGVLDIFLPAARGHWHGLFIEMKTPANKAKNIKKGTVSKAQEQFTERMQAKNYGAVTCYGWIDARDVIIGYLCTKTLVILS